MLGALASVTWDGHRNHQLQGVGEKLSIPGGPTLSLDAGVVTVATAFGRLPNGELKFVSQRCFGEHGPHPDLESGFELFCEVLFGALT